MLPFACRCPMSKVLSKSSRCVVSSWVSMTMARAWTSAGALEAGAAAAADGAALPAGGGAGEQATAKTSRAQSEGRWGMPRFYATAQIPA